MVVQKIFTDLLLLGIAKHASLFHKKDIPMIIIKAITKFLHESIVAIIASVSVNYDWKFIS